MDDGDFDVRNQRAEREWEEFYPYFLDRHGKLTDGRAHEPHGAGFPALIAPAYALGGAKAVELFIAAIAALGGVLAYLLALRVVPDPWAIGATLAVTLSPPFLAYGSAVYPELPAATALAGAALLALRLQERIIAQRGGGLLPAARHAAVAGDEVRARGRRDRLLRRAGDVAGAPPHARAAQRGARALQRRLLRHAERGALRRADAVLGRRRGRDRDRRELPRRVPRARLPAGRADDRPRVRAAALGARVRARGRRRLDARAHAARGARARAAAARARGVGGAPVRGRARRAAARRGVPRPHDVRLLVPAAAPARRAAAGGPAGRVGHAAARRGRARCSG